MCDRVEKANNTQWDIDMNRGKRSSKMKDMSKRKIMHIVFVYKNSVITLKLYMLNVLK